MQTVVREAIFFLQLYFFFSNSSNHVKSNFTAQQNATLGAQLVRLPNFFLFTLSPATLSSTFGEQTLRYQLETLGYFSPFV